MKLLQETRFPSYLRQHRVVRLVNNARCPALWQASTTRTPASRVVRSSDTYGQLVRAASPGAGVALRVRGGTSAQWPRLLVCLHMLWSPKKLEWQGIGPVIPPRARFSHLGCLVRLEHARAAKALWKAQSACWRSGV